MIKKRSAIVALFSFAVAKLSYADEQTPRNIPTLHTWDKPQTWTVILDGLKEIDVHLGKETVTLTAAEIFAALKE